MSQFPSLNNRKDLEAPGVSDPAERGLWGRCMPSAHSSRAEWQLLFSTERWRPLLESGGRAAAGAVPPGGGCRARGLGQQLESGSETHRGGHKYPPASDIPGAPENRDAVPLGPFRWSQEPRQARLVERCGHRAWTRGRGVHTRILEAPRSVGERERGRAHINAPRAVGKVPPAKGRGRPKGEEMGPRLPGWISTLQETLRKVLRAGFQAPGTTMS